MAGDIKRRGSAAARGVAGFAPWRSVARIAPWLGARLNAAHYKWFLAGASAAALLWTAEAGAIRMTAPPGPSNAANPSAESPRPETPLPSPVKSLRVVLDDNYPPYIFRNAAGQIEGLLPDMWSLWERKTGVAVEMIATDWAKAQEIMANGDADVIDTIFRTLAREAKYEFSAPYVDIPVSIYTHADLGGLSSVAGLQGFLIGVKDGDACVDRLKANDVVNLAPYPSYQRLVEAAVNGHIRAFCLDDPPAAYLLYKAGASAQFRQSFQLYSGAFHRAVRKNDVALLAMVERGFASFSEEEKKALRDKWLGAALENASFGIYLLYGVVAVVVLGGVVVLIIALLQLEVARRTEELRSEKIRLRTLLDTAPDLVWMKDADGVFLACNAQFEKLLGAREANIVGKTDYDFLPREMADFFRDHDRRAAANGGPSINEEEVVYAVDGRRATLETIKTPVYDAAGRLVGVLGIGRDITERRRQEQRLALAARVFESTADAVVLADPDQRIVAINRAFTEITGYGEKAALDRLLNELLESTRQTDQGPAQPVVNDGVWRGEVWSRRRNGDRFPEWRTVSAVKNDKDDIVSYVVVFSDITAVKRSQEALDFMAHHDVLTGLPNRAFLVRRLELALGAAATAQEMVAALFVDLDGFKHVNDSLGHAVGDELLRVVAVALSAKVGDAGFVARLGGDEFVVVLDKVKPADPALIAGTVNRLFDRPFAVGERKLYVTASIGVAVAPKDGGDADTLLKHADLALYAAKAQGKNTFRFFATEMSEKAAARQKLENALRDAMRNGELFLHYQPQVRLSDRRLTGVEALARWRSPEFGMVPPDKFIPLAEENGFILEIGAWVLREACRQAAIWRAAGLDVPRMAVNLSIQQIKHGKVTDLVAAACREARLDPSRLELEVTESMAMDRSSPSDALDELRAAGVSLSIDDFGAGHSSLSRLRHLPVQKLKIDRSFIQDIGRDRDDEIIVAAVTALGRSLGLEIVAEGVETEEQAAFLLNAGCDMGQGYLFARPMTGSELLARYRPDEDATGLGA